MSWLTRSEPYRDHPTGIVLQCVAGRILAWWTRGLRARAPHMFDSELAGQVVEAEIAAHEADRA